MTNQKTTKKALLSSALSLFVCLTMLIGTTFAWFTDSVTSTGNIIKSGKLDVELNYTSDFTDIATDKWKTVTAEEEAIWGYDKWEPGYVDVKYVQIANVGNLAFKYLLNIIPQTIVADGEANLADVIDVYIVAEPKKVIERTDLATMKKVGTLSELMSDADGAVRGILLPEGGDKEVEVLTAEERAITEVGAVTMGIALKMQESAGNEYQNLTVGGGFDVQLLATQYMYEEDSFDDTYDEDSKWAGEVATAEELQGALNSGGKIKLIDDIAATELLTVPEGVSATIDFNGHSLTNNVGMVLRNYGDLALSGEGTITGGAGGYAVRSDKGSVTINEDIVIQGGFGGMSLFGNTKAVVNNANISGNGREGSSSHIIYVSGTATLELNGGTYTHYGQCADGSMLYVASNGSVIVNDGTFNVEGNAYGPATSGSGSITINGGVFNNKSFFKWGGPITVTGGTFAADPKTYVPEGYSVVKSDDKYVVIEANNAQPVADGLYRDDEGEYYVVTGEGLAALNQGWSTTTYANAGLANKNTVINLSADIDFTGYTWTTVDSHADTAYMLKEINGNGYTISNLTIDGQAMFKRFAGNGDVTVKDITFDNAKVNSSALNSSILTVQSYQNVLLDNVDVTNSTITGTYKVAPLIATVYNEKSTTVTATLKNCDVTNCVVKATKYDFCTTGLVAFVNASDNDKIEFENCTVTDVTLIAPEDSYAAHAFVYTTGSGSLYNEAEGVTVTNCVFESK